MSHIIVGHPQQKRPRLLRTAIAIATLLGSTSRPAGGGGTGVGEHVEGLPKRLRVHRDRSCSRGCRRWRHRECRPWHLSRRIHDRQEPER